MAWTHDFPWHSNHLTTLSARPTVISSILVEVQIGMSLASHFFTIYEKYTENTQLQKSWMPSVRKHDVRRSSVFIAKEISFWNCHDFAEIRLQPLVLSNFHMVSTRSPSTRSWKGENPYWYGLDSRRFFRYETWNDSRIFQTWLGVFWYIAQWSNLPNRPIMVQSRNEERIQEDTRSVKVRVLGLDPLKFNPWNVRL